MFLISAIMQSASLPLMLSLFHASAVKDGMLLVTFYWVQVFPNMLSVALFLLLQQIGNYIHG